MLQYLEPSHIGWLNPIFQGLNPLFNPIPTPDRRSPITLTKRMTQGNAIYANKYTLDCDGTLSLVQVLMKGAIKTCPKVLCHNVVYLKEDGTSNVVFSTEDGTVYIRDTSLHFPEGIRGIYPHCFYNLIVTMDNRLYSTGGSAPISISMFSWVSDGVYLYGTLDGIYKIVCGWVTHELDSYPLSVMLSRKNVVVVSSGGWVYWVDLYNKECYKCHSPGVKKVEIMTDLTCLVSGRMFTLTWMGGELQLQQARTV